MNDSATPGPPSPTGHGDLFLARLLGNRHYRWTIYVFLFLTATVSLYYRVGMGGSVQVLPWYVSLMALYFLGMALKSRYGRSRIAHISFAILVSTAFTRELLRPHARVVGVVEVTASLLALAALLSLGKDAAFLQSGAVLESDHTRKDEPRNDNQRNHD